MIIKFGLIGVLATDMIISKELENHTRLYNTEESNLFYG